MIKNNYSFLQKVKLAIWLLRTKIISTKARIIRFPFDIRGRKFIDLGTNLTTGVGCRLEAFSSDGKKTLFFGNNVQINDYVHISSMKEVRIGNDVLMAGKIYISDNSHGYYKGNDQDSDPNIIPVERPYLCNSVFIEDNVWVGESVMILPGVTIGRGAIIGANSVVSKNIPAYSIAVGQPAKVIKIYNFDLKKWVKV